MPTQQVERNIRTHRNTQVTPGSDGVIASTGHKFFNWHLFVFFDPKKIAIWWVKKQTEDLSSHPSFQINTSLKQCNSIAKSRWETSSSVHSSPPKAHRIGKKAGLQSWGQKVSQGLPCRARTQLLESSTAALKAVPEQQAGVRRRGGTQVLRRGRWRINQGLKTSPNTQSTACQAVPLLLLRLAYSIYNIND